MADIDFEIETSIDFSSIFHIVSNQVGSNCLVEITYQVDDISTLLKYNISFG